MIKCPLSPQKNTRYNIADIPSKYNDHNILCSVLPTSSLPRLWLNFSAKPYFPEELKKHLFFHSGFTGILIPSETKESIFFYSFFKPKLIIWLYTTHTLYYQISPSPLIKFLIFSIPSLHLHTPTLPNPTQPPTPPGLFQFPRHIEEMTNLLFLTSYSLQYRHKQGRIFAFHALF